MEVSPRFSRDISKQDLATIAEHASDLSQPVSPSSSVTQSSILASLSNSVQNNTITMSPVVLSPQQPAIASVFLNSTPASANNSEPNSANSSYTNYNAVFTTNSSSSSSSSTATPATTNSPTPSHNPPPVTTNVSQLPSSPLPPSSLASSYASSVSEQPNAQAEVFIIILYYCYYNYLHICQRLLLLNLPLSLKVSKSKFAFYFHFFSFSFFSSRSDQG